MSTTISTASIGMTCCIVVSLEMNLEMDRIDVMIDLVLLQGEWYYWIVDLWYVQGSNGRYVGRVRLKQANV